MVGEGHLLLDCQLVCGGFVDAECGRSRRREHGMYFGERHFQRAALPVLASPRLLLGKDPEPRIGAGIDMWSEGSFCHQSATDQKMNISRLWNLAPEQSVEHIDRENSGQ